MSHTFNFTVSVTVERVQGKFAPRDEIVEPLIEALQEVGSADVSGIGADGTSEYEITDFDVQETT